MPSDIPAVRLRDIITNIDRIHMHLDGVTLTRGMDAKTRDAVERCLERISEAVRKLGPAMDARRPGIPWRNIRGLGNIMRHDYDVVDDAAIERIVAHELVMLREACVDELGALDKATGHT
jgi:uncharacterized protein with HEPN domain